MTRAVAFGLLLACCTFTRDKRDDEHLSVQEHEEVHAEQAQTETRTEGPETITTTVEEWEVPVLHDGATGVARAASESSATSAVAQSVEHRPLAGREAVGSTPIGGPLAGAVVLVRRTVTVDQRGPILDTKRQTEKEASSATQTVQAEAKSATKTKTAPALSAWLWGALIAAAIAAIGWFAWKMSPLGKVL